MFQLGQLIDALTDADRAAELADAAGTTFLLTRVMMGQAMINSTLGNHDLAERLCNDAVALSDRHNLMLVQMAIGYGIGRDRGQQAELARLEQQFGEFVDPEPVVGGSVCPGPAPRPGNSDDATRLLGVLQEAAPWPRNWLWLGTTVAALEAAVLTGDTDMSRRFAAVLTPYSGQWALAGAELACWGPVDRVLGLTSTAAGRRDEARVLLTSALDVATSQGASPWVTPGLATGSLSSRPDRADPEVCPRCGRRAMAEPGWAADAGDMTPRCVDDEWLDAIDVSEQHCIDFDVVRDMVSAW